MRVILGFVAALPFLLVAYAVLVLSRTHDFWPNWFWFGMPIAVYAGMGVYVWNVWHNPAVPAEKRGLWTALIVFGNMCVLPFYFAFYIWPKHVPTVPPAGTSTGYVPPN